jgi:hypothetical protein
VLVKLKTNLGSNDFPGMPFLEGEKREVTDDIGQKLVRLKLAEDVTPPPEPPKAAKPERKPEPTPEAHPAKTTKPTK